MCGCSNFGSISFVGTQVQNNNVNENTPDDNVEYNEYNQYNQYNEYNNYNNNNSNSVANTEAYTNYTKATNNTTVPTAPTEPVSYHISEADHLFTVPDDISKRNITYDTPENKGVNLRSAPNSNSSLIMVIPEGTKVTYLGGSGNSNYDKIAVVVGDVVYVGYVMHRYLTTFTGSVYDCEISRNSFNGANLKSEDYDDSKTIVFLPSGTDVKVIQGTIGANEYCCVEAFYNDQIYTGYVWGRDIIEK